jgi:hypothetical protein
MHESAAWPSGGVFVSAVLTTERLDCRAVRLAVSSDSVPTLATRERKLCQAEADQT